MGKSDAKQTWYVQPEGGSWINGVFQKQNSVVLMTDDEAKYLAMANILGDKPFEKATPAPEPASAPAVKPAKKGSAK